MVTANCDTLSKRVLFITKLILTLLTINVILFTNFLDLQENRNNAKYLDFLKNVHEAGENKLRFENFELERISHIKKTNPLLGNKHIETRNSLIKILKRYGVSITRNMKGQGEAKNLFSLMSNEKMQTQMIKHQSNEHGQNGYKSNTRIATIDSALVTFKRYSNFEEGYFVTGLDTATLVNKLDSVSDKVSLQHGIKTKLNDSTPEDDWRYGPRGTTGIATGTGGPSNTSFLGGKKFNRILLFKDTLHVLFGNGREEMGTGQGTDPNSLNSISVKVEIDTIIFPPILKYSGLDTIILEELSNNSKKLKVLKNLYGYYELSMIDEITSDSIRKNSDSVSILGFDISRKWFPIAMFLILASAFFILYESLKQSKQNSYNVVSDDASEDVLQFIVSKKYIRLFLWIITPLILFIFILYSTSTYYDYIFYIVMILCLGFCLILGFLCYNISMKL